jgi:hypothetical protein
VAGPRAIAVEQGRFSTGQEAQGSRTAVHAETLRFRRPPGARDLRASALRVAARRR